MLSLLAPGITLSKPCLEKLSSPLFSASSSWQPLPAQRSRITRTTAVSQPNISILFLFSPHPQTLTHPHHSRNRSSHLRRRLNSRPDLRWRLQPRCRPGSRSHQAFLEAHLCILGRPSRTHRCPSRCHHFLYCGPGRVLPLWRGSSWSHFRGQVLAPEPRLVFRPLLDVVDFRSNVNYLSPVVHPILSVTLLSHLDSQCRTCYVVRYPITQNPTGAPACRNAAFCTPP